MSSDASPGEPSWHVSHACESGTCIKIVRQGDKVFIRTGNPAAPVVEFTTDEWRHFLAGVKLGDFDDIA